MSDEIKYTSWECPLEILEAGTRLVAERLEAQREQKELRRRQRIDRIKFGVGCVIVYEILSRTISYLL